MTPFRALKVYKKAMHPMCNLKKPPAPNTVKLEVGAEKNCSIDTYGYCLSEFALNSSDVALYL